MTTSSIIVRELQRIREQNHRGILHAEAVVRAARDKRSPLHHKFEWNNAKAGHQHRLWQARRLIAEVEIVYAETESREIAFISLRHDRYAGGGYRDVGEVLGDAKLRAEMLRTALLDFQPLQAKYGRLKELAGVWSALKKVKREAARV